MEHSGSKHHFIFLEIFSVIINLKKNYTDHRGGDTLPPTAFLWLDRTINSPLFAALIVLWNMNIFEHSSGIFYIRRTYREMKISSNRIAVFSQRSWLNSQTLTASGFNLQESQTCYVLYNDYSHLIISIEKGTRIALKLLSCRLWGPTDLTA